MQTETATRGERQHSTVVRNYGDVFCGGSSRLSIVGMCIADEDVVRYAWDVRHRNGFLRYTKSRFYAVPRQNWELKVVMEGPAMIPAWRKWCRGGNGINLAP